MPPKGARVGSPWQQLSAEILILKIGLMVQSYDNSKFVLWYIYVYLDKRYVSVYLDITNRNRIVASF